MGEPQWDLEGDVILSGEFEVTDTPDSDDLEDSLAFRTRLMAVPETPPSSVKPQLCSLSLWSVVGSSNIPAEEGGEEVDQEDDDGPFSIIPPPLFAFLVEKSRG